MHDERKSQAQSGGQPTAGHDASGQHAGMTLRGVTRPMMDGEDDGDSGGMTMSEDDRHHMLVQHHRRTLWCYWTIVLLGVWLAVSPATFAYDIGTVTPSGGRSVWLSLDARALAMTWNDIVCGLLLVGFGWRALKPNRPVSLWICCLVGCWLQVAPLVFWAPTAAIYLNDTLVGVLVIALSVLIPGMPNMIAYMRMGPAVPPGWSYNPSSWAQRSVMIGLGFAGWLVSR